MTEAALTITEAADLLDPPIPRRELARRLRHVRPLRKAYGRAGRRAALYPVGVLFRVHAEWVAEQRERETREAR